MPFIESLEEFCERQGCKPLVVKKRYLFPNGAQSNGREHYDPPTSRGELEELRYEYMKVDLERKVRRYNQLRKGIAQQIRFNSLGMGPAPPEDWQEQLQRIVATVEQLQAQVSKLARKYERDPFRDHNERATAERVYTSEQAMSELQQFPDF